MLSIADDLQVALQDLSSILQEMSFPRDLLAPPCQRHVMDLNQGSQLLDRLSQYQMCVEPLVSLSPDVDALCRVVTLNHDLLQHLGGSHQDSVVCPSSSSSSSPSNFDSVRKSLRCVQCWSQQVAALRR